VVLRRGCSAPRRRPCVAEGMLGGMHLAGGGEAAEGVRGGARRPCVQLGGAVGVRGYWVAALK
jgi:hypothetical protein